MIPASHWASPWVAIALLATPLPAFAITDAEFQALKEQLDALTATVEALQKELATERARSGSAEPVQPAVAATPEPEPESWADTLRLTGDLRLRYENIDQENRADERNRMRIRARAAVIARPQDGLEVGFGLATAQDADPVSSNQTIGSGGSRKDIYLDLAYFNWQATEGLNIVGGKFKNTLARPGKHGLIWDGDLNPEGFGLTYANGPFFANLLGTWVESDSNGTEAFGFGGQIGTSLALGDAAKLTAGAGYFGVNSAGKGAFFVVPGQSPRFFGNTVDDDGLYVNDYDMVELFAELGFKVLGQPASVFADFVTNSDADEFDSGWAAGASIGAAKAQGSWEASYTYQDLERDAVFGLWTDSDFGGGGTDNSGHVLRGAYALSDKTNVAFSYFFNEFGEDANDGIAVDYDRLQLDLNFKY
ncbi:MAG: hypothetical protein FJ197_11410 [Gammaproteobacteria bacterium]|nr:hypothetical protein [Gammaproteobacteria bacterium]